MTDKKREKRTEAEMIASLAGDRLEECVYVKRRIQSLEEKISELVAAISPAGRELLLESRPDLAKFLP
jgi:hypothetical protein